MNGTKSGICNHGCSIREVNARMLSRGLILINFDD